MIFVLSAKIDSICLGVLVRIMKIWYSVSSTMLLLRIDVISVILILLYLREWILVCLLMRSSGVRCTWIKINAKNVWMVTHSLKTICAFQYRVESSVYRKIILVTVLSVLRTNYCIKESVWRCSITSREIVKKTILTV